MNIEQTYRIKRILALRGETITSMAQALGIPVSTVAATIYGRRPNRERQRRIADYLVAPVEIVFDKSPE